MNRIVALRVMIIITLGLTVVAAQQSYGKIRIGGGPIVAAPIAISGDNIYIAWWANETGNDEAIFRASTDGGQTFSDKINLSNSTGSDSTRVEIDSDADSVIVTWWERNQTDDTPVMRVSNDNGATFGPILMLAANNTLSSEEEGVQ